MSRLSLEESDRREEEVAAALAHLPWAYLEGVTENLIYLWINGEG